MAKISIIIPIYNVEDYLERCLNSLINQTLNEIEIICINDGSTDKSLNIIKKYKDIDNRIILITHENKGIGYVRNEGIKIAQGEFIGFVDPDDWVDLNFFERLYKTAQKYNADIAVAGFIRLSKKKKNILLEYKSEIATSNIDDKLKLCDVPDQNYVWNKIYKLKNIKKENIHFPLLTAYEDVVTTPEIIYKLKKLVTVPNIYYYYWKRKGSLITLKDKRKDYTIAENMTKEYCNKYNIPIEKYRTKIKKFKFLGLTIFKTINKGDQRKIIILNFIKIKTKNR